MGTPRLAAPLDGGFAWLLLLAPLAGCLTDSGLAAEEPLVGFAAEYGTSRGGLIQIEFLAPRMTMDRDLAVRSAYVLDVSIVEGSLATSAGSPSPPLQVRFHLDASLHVMRVDTCPIADTCDSQLRASWTEQGLAPPLGIFWPRLDSHDTLTIMGQRMPWPREASELDRGTRITVEASPAPHLLEFVGQYEYREGLSIPTRIQGQVRLGEVYAMEADLKSYVPGDALEAAHMWPNPEVERRPSSSTPLLFPGEDAQVIGRPFTHVQAFNELLNQSPRASELMAQGGCVTGVSVTPVSGQGGFGDSDSQMLGSNASTLQFRIASGDKQYSEFELEYQTGVLFGPPTWRASETGDRGAGSCDSKWGVGFKTDLPQFLDLVDRLPIVDDPPTNAYGVIWTPKPSWRNQAGDATFFAAPFHRIANSGFTVTNQVYYLPGPGWWDSMYLPRSTLESLDSGSDPAYFPTGDSTGIAPLARHQVQLGTTHARQA